MPSLLILLPLIGMIILNMPGGKFMYRTGFWFAAAIFLAQIILAIMHHPEFGSQSFDRIDAIFRVSFSIDHLSSIMLISTGIVCLASLLVARAASLEDKDRSRLVNLLIISSIGMNGIVMVRDLFSLYVFLEVTAVSSFIMIAHGKDVEALEGAFKYMILSAVASVLMLSSIALIMLISKDTSFSSIHDALAGSVRNPLISLSIATFLCGLFIKGGVVPFHGWLPDAYMAAPASVSVLLAGIVTKASGVYTIIRLSTSVFGFTHQVKTVLLILGTISILVGAFAALGQSNFKRMLAYSSISQVGYIILGLGTGSALGLMGSVFHLFNHSIFKSLLFVNAVSVERRTGTCDMSKMGGISQKMPVTGATSIIGMLSTCGIPPLSGFWSKLMIIIALWQAGNLGFAVIAVLASVLTLAYFLSLQRRVFFGRLSEGMDGLSEARGELVLASIILASITVGVGILFPMVFNIFLVPLKSLILY